MAQSTAFPSFFARSGLRTSGFDQPPGRTWFVSTSSGSDSVFGGVSSTTCYKTISKALAAASPGDVILIAPGSYAETVTIPRSAKGIKIVGLGNKGAVGISPAGTNANGLVNDADDVTLDNLDVNAKGTGTALINTGNSLCATRCKFENDDGTGLCVQLTLQTVAQKTAGTKGNGADVRLEGCEFAWAADGLEFTGTDQGAVTEPQIVGCWFHDINGNHIKESVGSGGTAAVTYASILLDGNKHGRAEDNTIPTAYVLLNADNGNTGLMTGCVFPEAEAGGKVLVSTGLVVVGCFYTGGISTGQPS